MRDFIVWAVGLVVGGLVVSIAKLPVREITAVVLENHAAGVAAVAALFALISGVLGPFVQWRVGRRQAAASQTAADASMLTAKTAGAREIAKLRMAWMDKLRDTLSEYHAILMSLKDETLETEWLGDSENQKLSQLGTQLDLLLNQNDTKQKQLWDIADRIYHLKTKTERHALDNDLVAAGREVLKGEWEKVKREMRGDGFQTGEAPVKKAP